MVNYKKLVLLLTTSLLSAVIISCNDDGPTITPPDFSIISTETMEVLSAFDNGWIKQGVKKDIDGTNLAEFEYFENGHLKTLKKYERFPEYHLFMELERDENNLPVSSKYYNTEGNLHLQFTYENGSVVSKLLDTEEARTLTTYESGQKTEEVSESKISDEVITNHYNYSNNTRTMTIRSNDNVLFTDTFDLDAQEGYGINTKTGVPHASIVTDFRSISNDINTNTIYGIQGASDIQEFINSQTYYDKVVYPSEDARLKLLFASNDEFYRSNWEQYAFVEDEILVSVVQHINQQVSFLPSAQNNSLINNELSQNRTEFERLYGNQYYQGYITGYQLLSVVTLRNLPTQDETRDRIKDIAKRKAQILLTGTNNVAITDEEQDLLSNVFFQLKLHSSAFDDISGIVINSYEENLQALGIVMNSREKLIQRTFLQYPNF